MSKGIARGLSGLIHALVAPLSQRQRAKVLARLIGHLGGKTPVTVTTARGQMQFLPMVGPHVSGILANFDAEEPETREWIDCYIKRGEVLWDIGACIGLHSVYAALDKSIRVIAFEPSAPNFGVLTEHIRLNQMEDRIAPLCMALSSSRQLATLSIGRTDPGSAENALATEERNAHGARQLVPVFTGDELCDLFPSLRPNHIKLDVDSIEGEILRGLARTLPHISTVIVEVENENLRNVDAVIEAPLLAAGFVEVEQVRKQGSHRNRMYVNRCLTSINTQSTAA